MLNSLPFILNVLEAITIIVTPVSLLITLIILTWQTRQFSKQIKLGILTSTTLDLKGVNELLLHDEKLAQLLGESREDVLASIILNTMQMWFILHKQRMVDQLWWRAAEMTISETMKRDFVRSYWVRTRLQYSRKFAQFLDERLPKPVHEVQTSSTIPSP
jgi:hypothetical protein